jgi:ribose 5-phosphate isomerase B
MRIGISSDHAGYNLKSAIIKNFNNSQFQFIDYGCDNAKDSVDYPDIAAHLCHKFISNEFDFGILICGSGIGISIAANRFHQIRAALCHNKETAILSRQHNDANVLCLGQRVTDQEITFEAVAAFLNTKFSGSRHQARVDKLSN